MSQEDAFWWASVVVGGCAVSVVLASVRAWWMVGRWRAISSERGYRGFR